MKNKKLLRLASLIGLLFSTQKADAFSQTNFTMPYEGYLWQSSKYFLPDYFDKDDPKAFRLNVGVGIEYGWDFEGRAKDNKSVDVLSIYSDSELFFNMDLLTSGNNSALKTALIAYCNSGLPAAPHADENQVFASNFKYKPNSSMSETDLTLKSKLSLPIEALPGQLELEACLPIKFVEISNVKWTKRPADAAAANQPPVGTTNTVVNQNTEMLVNGLQETTGYKIKKYNDSNIGDTYIGLSWKNHYTQVNDSLSSVGLLARIGVSLPTSKKADAKDVLAFPFGNDGCLGIPMGGAINLNFAKNFRIGGAASVVIFMGETSSRYLKSKETEGSIILGKSFNAHKDPGAELSFSALAELLSSCKKYAVGMMYEFIKKNEDKYTSNSEGFSAAIANSAESAKEKIRHNLILRGSVDFREMTDSEYAPMFSVAFKYPLRAERATVCKSITLDASISF